MWQPGWEGSWGRVDTCMCMAESFDGLRETVTTLLTGYTPVQNKKLKKNESMHKEDVCVSVCVYIIYIYTELNGILLSHRKRIK